MKEAKTIRGIVKADFLHLNRDATYIRNFQDYLLNDNDPMRSLVHFFTT